MSFDRKDTAKQLHLSEPVARAIAARPLPGERESHAEPDRPVQQCLSEPLVDESASLGPLDALMGDPQITDILVNRHDRIYIERNGRLELTKIVFRDAAHLRDIIDRIVVRVGRRIDQLNPMVDARLSDGSRVNAIIPPLAMEGPALSIRRFGSRPIKVEDLIQQRSVPAVIMQFLATCVQARCNILISGGTGAGKTTLLNCLSRFIPPEERVITIEDAAELQLQQPHTLRLETRPATLAGDEEITQRQLLRNSLRMRPDRIIVGEVRSSEALDMLQAMNTGHEGSMATIHANSARDALSRLEIIITLAGFDIPVRALRGQISAALQLIVQVQRVPGGQRKITSVSEITGMEGDKILMHDLFLFDQSGVDPQGHATGRFLSTGIRPRFAHRIEQAGLRLPAEWFTPGVIR